jgi:hypothetical protein
MKTYNKFQDRFGNEYKKFKDLTVKYNNAIKLWK